MQKYELLAIFPGTLTEDEVVVGAQSVKELMEKQGGMDIQVENLGKSRLAYPMKHIRYGYFRMYYFSAEPTAVQLLQVKLDLSHLMLRAIVRVYNPKSEVKKISQIMSDIAISSAIEEAREARKDTASTTHETIQTFSRFPKAEAPMEEKITASVPLEDIDKKLDELLESDLTKV